MPPAGSHGYPGQGGRARGQRLGPDRPEEGGHPLEGTRRARMDRQSALHGNPDSFAERAAHALSPGRLEGQVPNGFGEPPKVNLGSEDAHVVESVRVRRESQLRELETQCIRMSIDSTSVRGTIISCIHDRWEAEYSASSGACVHHLRIANQANVALPEPGQPVSGMGDIFFKPRPGFWHGCNVPSLYV